MRLVILQVPRGEGDNVLKAAGQHSGVNSASFQSTDIDGNPIDQVVVHLPNDEVGPFLNDVEPVPDLRASLLPSGVVPIRPPSSEIADQAVDVSPRSAFEIFVSGLQSIGSWKGFLGYAGIAGVVVWLALFTNTSYLLVAAMLIAPFVGPAMNAALASARGDLNLLWHSILRYFSALGVTIATAAILSFAFRQETATQMMGETANISTTAVLLPIAAGAAGALNLSQSERSSLVPGAAAGMLVAASLAPPAGITGMGAVIGEWDMVVSGLFLLGLQLVGINLAGAAVFRLFGLRAEGPRLERGRSGVVWGSFALAAIALALFMLVQFGSGSPDFQRATLEQRARSSVLTAVNANPDIEPVQLDVSFTRADIPGQNALLVELYIQPSGNVDASDEDLRQEVTTLAQQSILEQNFNVTPLVAVTVVKPPANR
ncbi:MAG TPA: DUF389 domain-containing protein [Thermomicrobiales bacterium]|nr:DUF389 domain-containing protein [Thermomicrobiales bacterium]